MNWFWNRAVVILDFFLNTSFASVYVFSRKNYSAHYFLLYFLHYFVITIFSNFVYREMESYYIRRIFFWRVSISINLAPWIFQDTSCIFRYSLILLHSPLANENLTSISRRKLNDPQFLALQQPRSKLGNDARSCCCWY